MRLDSHSGGGSGDGGGGGGRPEPGVTTGLVGTAAPANKLRHCSHCGYSTNKKFNFDNHLRIHTGEKPFACAHCQYRAATKDTLKRHILIHTGEKPYACKVCSYRCTQSGTLKNHTLSHHSNLASLPRCNRWCVSSNLRVFQLLYLNVDGIKSVWMCVCVCVCVFIKM